ncbi:ANTH-domain-containing protein [Schizophyllum commune H4-8]|nr:ANTH-domain-containing protein [Schizophyllum commune H4-8]KAI5894683.1 ANTH-domain-containing protein [Schizophyllum commune H4-8]
MSSFDKVVKLACKPKANPPKSKYLEPIIAATWSEEGAVGDVCKALAPRFREPNAIVVFKALIVLHTMMRSGATDNVLGFLCSHDVLRLRNVSAGNWEGYQAPQNLQHYAIYLDSRIRAFSELKHDAIRVQAENNRDMRNSHVVDDELGINVSKYKAKSERSKSASAGVSRSKTVMGRKLRVMTVEKGLLRETKAVHRMIDALVECRFYLDDLEDELTITALRMLVKDLLILFQAGNEGVINLLEHYFEMSHVDAEAALRIYKHFCKQTEKVVEFLGVARKLQNLLNVSIPNLKHAPVSLASALQEYLDDPNFEQNRIEYRANKEAVDKGIVKETDARRSKPEDKPSTSSSTPSNATTPSTSTNKNVIDFFAAIEEEQPTMFNPQTNSPNSAYFQQNQIANPFVQRQITGMPMQQPGMMPQQTGMPMQQPFVAPQQTGFNPFGMQQQQQPQQLLQPQATGHRPFSSFLPDSHSQPQFNGLNPSLNGISGSASMGAMPQQPQMTGMPSLQVNGSFPNGQQQQQLSNTAGVQLPQFPGTTLRANALTPQMTGSNPFRASSVLPQTTGFQASPFGQQQQQPFQSSPFGSQQQLGQQQPFQPTPSFGASLFGAGGQQQQPEAPARPASAPLGAMKSASPPPQPVKTHQTGTKNPFGPVVQPPPPVPKVPTLMELAMGYGKQQNGQQQPNGQQQQQQNGQNGPLQLQTTGFGASLFGSGSQTGGMGSSLFSGASQQQQQSQQTGAGSSGLGLNSSALGAGPTDMSSVASSFAKSDQGNGQNNNGSGPSSSLFGNTSSLNPQNTSTTITTTSASLFSHATGISSQPTGLTSQPTGASGGLRPQTTGFQSSLKPFKPSSSFGASLLESLPPIPGSSPATPAVTGSQPNGQANGQVGNGSSQFSLHASSGSLGGTSSGPGSGATTGVGLRPQMTGGANPFRPQTMFALGGNGAPPMPAFNGGGLGSQPTGAFGGLSSQPTGAFGALGSQPTGAFGGLSSQPTGFTAQSSFGQSLFGQQQNQQQQQTNQPPTASLI